MANDKVFHTLFWILFFGILVIRVFSVFQIRRAGGRFMPDEKAVEQEGKTVFAVRVVGFFALLGLLAAFAINPVWMRRLDLPFAETVRWLGFALGLASLMVWAWAQVTLGRQWSPQVQLQASHQLITTGPYAWVRHPLYAVLVGVSVAFALVTASLPFIAFGLLAIAMLPSRIRAEERMMMEGVDGYREYAARVRYRLLPYIW